MLDLLIADGFVIDGTGAPGKRGDVGVRDGRIVALGSTDEPARRRIDADGLVVAPGIVDIHTHYDAQVFWDTSLSPSSLHGITTVVGGNCGFSIAPLTPEAGPYLMKMLSKVEGMPLESLEQGVPWDWRSFGDYLDRFEGTLAINAGFLVGHSALRRVAMGPAAVGERATPEHIARMQSLLHESLAGGALGFSSSQATTHNDGDGNPVPSRFATDEELALLCSAVGDHPGTTLEFIPTVGPFGEEHCETMTRMSLAANRPLNWNVLVVNPEFPEMHESQLRASDHAAARGARVVALTLPYNLTIRVNLASGFLFDVLPGWGPIIALPLDERMRALSDPSVREQLKKGWAEEPNDLIKSLLNWENFHIAEAFTPEVEPLLERRIGDIARERDRDALDVMLEIAISEQLRTSFHPPAGQASDATWRLRAELWRDERTVIGASDSGAHLDMMDSFSYAVQVLGPAVRERQLLSLEDAIHQLTEVPAALYGIRDRGRIAPGAWADLVLFDPARVGPGQTYTRPDLPAGASRLYAEPEGIEHVLVNGSEIARGKRLTGESPGRVLRSGRDTRTVELSGA